MAYLLLNIFGALLLSVALVNAGANFETGDSFQAKVYTEVNNPRGLFVDSAGDILVSASNIIALSETSTGEVTQNVIASGAGLGLNHGVTVHGGYLYASSQTKVYAWPYTAGSRSLIRADPVTVVENIPSGGHSTRTLIFDSESRLYVSVGSNANVDGDSSRARIRRFDFSEGLPQNAYDFSDGEVIKHMHCTVKFKQRQLTNYISMLLSILFLGIC